MVSKLVTMFFHPCWIHTYIRRLVTVGRGSLPKWSIYPTPLGCPRKLGSMVRINGLLFHLRPAYKWVKLGLWPTDPHQLLTSWDIQPQLSLFAQVRNSRNVPQIFFGSSFTVIATWFFRFLRHMSEVLWMLSERYGKVVQKSGKLTNWCR